MREAEALAERRDAVHVHLEPVASTLYGTYADNHAVMERFLRDGPNVPPLADRLAERARCRVFMSRQSPPDARHAAAST
jgi:hypothetical protein